MAGRGLVDEAGLNIRGSGDGGDHGFRDVPELDVAGVGGVFEELKRFFRRAPVLRHDRPDGDVDDGPGGHRGGQIIPGIVEVADPKGEPDRLRCLAGKIFRLHDLTRAKRRRGLGIEPQSRQRLVFQPQRDAHNRPCSRRALRARPISRHGPDPGHRPSGVP